MFYRSIFRSCGRLLATVVLSTLAWQAQAMPQEQLREAQAHFAQAQAGDRSAIDKAAEAFGTMLRVEPANPLLMAYAGASTAMRASTTFLPWKKIGYAEDGMAMLDKALALLDPTQHAAEPGQTPDALMVRFLAANTFLAVPDFMNRRDRGAQLLAEVVAHPLLAQAPLGFRGAVWLRAARWAQADKRADDARRYANEIIRNGAPQAEAAQALLKGLGS